MSQAQIEQFASRVKNDSAMFNKLTAGTQTPDEFIDKSVAVGAESGFSFTRDEADGWIKGQIEAKANGELSDLQLEGVAGGKGPGKGTAVSIHDNVTEVRDTKGQDAVSQAATTVLNWLMSW